MSVHADFYVGRGHGAEWLGSIVYDGHPVCIPEKVWDVADQRTWRKNVAWFLEKTLTRAKPEYGWPWPWDDSTGTNYSYTFDDNKTWFCRYGAKWTYLPRGISKKKINEIDFKVGLEEKAVPLSKREPLPDMSHLRKHWSVAGSRVTHQRPM